LWKKRGISFVPICYPFSCGSKNFYFHLSVYVVDGSVAISHGGTEMGQVPENKNVRQKCSTKMVEKWSKNG
jgi:xanthine dehydrogenase molybdopterin-binding subunit B